MILRIITLKFSRKKGYIKFIKCHKNIDVIEFLVTLMFYKNV